MSAPPNFTAFIPPPLPPGWTEHQAPGGQPYYYHAATNQSTYTRPIPTGPFPGGLPFIPPGAVIPGAKEKKKKEKPLLKTPVPGTQWIRVKTTEGNVFWTHKEKKESVWVVPDEIKEKVEEMEREEKQKQEEEQLEKERIEKEKKEQEEEENKRREQEEVVRVMEEVKGAVAAGKRKASEPAEDTDTDKMGSKKARVEEVTDEDDKETDEEHMQNEGAAELTAEEKTGMDVPDTATKVEPPPKRKKKDGKTSFTVPDRVNLSIEESKALFKTLLTEKNINPLHPWDTSLPLFISDPRYVLLPSVAARREAFDEYCRDAARAQRAAKAAALKEAADRATSAGLDKDKEAYNRLLKEEVTSTRMSWTDFRRKWKKDRRFFGWAGEREREKAFREWIKELGEVKKKQAEKAEREFFQLLREHKEIKPADEWREAYIVKRKIDSKDPRYDAVNSSSLREELFGTYIKTLAQTTLEFSKSNQEDEQKTADQDQDQVDYDARKKERAERSLREREEKIRRERAGLEREIGRTRGALGREEGEREFTTLLTDAVRDPQAKWDVIAPSLSNDPRFVLSALPLPVQKELFSKHVMRLREKYIKGLNTLFAAHVPGLNTRWPDVEENAHKAIRGSVPVSKLGFADPESDMDYDSDDSMVTRKRRKDVELEAEFERWQRVRNGEARQAFDVMLGENAFLEFWGRMGKAGGAGTEGGVPADDEEEEDGEGGGGKADLKKLAKGIDINEVGKVLKGDSRWSAFDHVPEQRERWLRDYMERLAAPKLSVHIPDKDRS
ncbi:hypothetical protein BU17DRAFT_75079 [Hysterangium stoloniferum]|nr:hypothetical protein BU17DRAFT_75079 [Hysterangium stoloniferum]